MKTSPHKLTLIARASRFDRDAIPPELRNSLAWPGPGPDFFATASQAELARHDRFARAIEAFLQNAPLGYCLALAKVGNSAFYAQVARCLAIHPDGQIWGFRALVKRVRVHQGAAFTAAYNDLTRTHTQARMRFEAQLRQIELEIGRLSDLFDLQLEALRRQVALIAQRDKAFVSVAATELRDRTTTRADLSRQYLVSIHSMERF